MFLARYGISPTRGEERLAPDINRLVENFERQQKDLIKRMEEQPALKIHDLLSAHPSWTAARDLPTQRQTVGGAAGSNGGPGDNDPRRGRSRCQNDDEDQPNRPQEVGNLQVVREAGAGPPGGGPPDKNPSDASFSDSEDQRKKKKKEKKANASDYLKKKFGELPIKEEPEEAEEKRKKTMRDLRNSLSGFQQGAGVDLVGLLEAIGKITKREKVDSTKDLTLSDYHGDLAQWTNFWAIFTALVDKNSRLSTINKFHKLQTACKGPAFRVIQGIHFNEANYKLVKKTLTSYYGSADNILNAATENFRRIPKCKDHDFVKFQELVQATNNWLHQLSLHHNSLFEDPGLVIRDIERKLPDLVMENWYCHCSLHMVPLDQPADAGKLTLLIDFMEAELKMKLYQHGADLRKWNQQGNGGGNGNNGNSSHRNGGGNGNGRNGGHRKTASNFSTEAFPAKDSKTTSTTTETNASTYVGKRGGEKNKATAPTGERPKKCCFCATPNHPAFKCKKKKAPKEMLQLAKKDGLCINCLRWGHFVKNCQKGQCGESGWQKKHH